MEIELKVHHTAEIFASAARIWECITDPELIEIWLHGWDYQISEWKTGVAFSAFNNFEGLELSEKCNVLTVVPESILEFNFLTSWEDLDDVPENYKILRYEINRISENHTRLNVLYVPSEPDDHTEAINEGWNNVLIMLKQLAESR